MSTWPRRFSRRAAEMSRRSTSTRYRARPSLQVLEGRIAPATFTVTDASDSGVKTGTLRWAIFQANNAPGPDTIVFGPQFNSPQEINLAGKLEVWESVSIIGPGSNLLTLNAHGSSIVLDCDRSASGLPMSINLSGMTITGGYALGEGGGITIGPHNFTLNDMTVTANPRGGISGGGGTLAISNSTISNNAGTGGVLLQGGSLTIVNSTVSGNSPSLTGYGGGITFSARGPSDGLTVRNSTISGNTTPSGGGGLRLYGTTGAGGFTIANSTISGNTASVGGGVRFDSFAGNAVIENCTITNNTALTTSTAAGQAGGGISKSSGSGTLTLTSSIVSGNTAPNSLPKVADLSNFGGPIVATNCAIGVDPGPLVLASPSVGNLGFGAAINLGPLANNGGPVQTHALNAGSLAIDHGVNPAGAATDARGQPRVTGTAADIGAYESTFSAAAALATVADVTTAASTHLFTVTYIDAVGINLSTLDGSDVRVTGPNGFDVPATLVSIGGGVGSPPTATYRIAVPGGGSWSNVANGSYRRAAAESGEEYRRDGRAGGPDRVISGVRPAEFGREQRQ